MTNNQQAKKQPRKRAWKFVSSESVWMDESLSMEAIIVWHILSIYADHKTGAAYPSASTIQRISRMGRHRVNVAVKALTKAGAISRELKRRKHGTAIYGSQAHYTVKPLHKWVTKKHVLESPGCPEIGLPGAGLPGISTEHIPTDKHIPTGEQKPNTTPQLALGQPLSLTLPETEALLAGLGIGGSKAFEVWAKLDGLKWLDPETGAGFPNRANLEAFMARLGERMEACAQGDAPAGRGRKRYVAPVETAYQQASCDNDGPGEPDNA